MRQGGRDLQVNVITDVKAQQGESMGQDCGRELESARDRSWTFLTDKLKRFDYGWEKGF